MKRIVFLVLFMPLLVFADDMRDQGSNPTSVVEDSICIPELNGQGCLHVDEDVANLVIKVIGADGTTIATYDDGTELEDIAAIGTYAAPNANNVRVSPQSNGGADLTQMMFADSVYNGQDWITITVSDGQTTIMDYSRVVFLAKSLATAQSDLDDLTDGLILATGTCDSGSVSSCVDATLTSADTDYWAKNAAIVFTSSTVAGQVFCVASFVPGSDTVNFTPTATQAVSTNTYVIIAAPGCDPYR